jgi:hypothetical protein
MVIASGMGLAQNSLSGPLGGLFSGGFMLFGLGGAVLFIIGCWKVFEKAGQPGWAAIIPIYNAYILLKIAGRPGWWLVLYFIPIVNFVIAIVISVDIAKAFGQSAVFGFFLLFLFFGIGFLILGFGNYRYQGAQTIPAMA